MLKKDIVRIGKLFDSDLQVKRDKFPGEIDELRCFGPQESVYRVSDIAELTLEMVVTVSLENNRRVCSVIYLDHDNIVAERKEIKEIKEIKSLEDLDLISKLDWLKNNPASEGGSSLLAFVDMEETWVFAFHFDGDVFDSVKCYSRSGRKK